MNTEEKKEILKKYVNLINTAKNAVIDADTYFRKEVEIHDFKDMGDTEEANEVIRAAENFEKTIKQLMS